jgi:acyl-CoA synthetase (NDP forming)
MGGIIDGPRRFAEVVDRFAGSGDFDCVLAVSTAHPPAHTAERVEGLLALRPHTPVLHLWMAGDLGDEGLSMLRRAHRPVITEPRAAMKALAALLQPSWDAPPPQTVGHSVVEAPNTEHGAKVLASEWGLPVVEGGLAATAEEAVEIACRLGSPVAMKVSARGLIHKTEAGGVRLGVDGANSVHRAFDEIVDTVGDRVPNLVIDGVRVERMAAGFEVIVGLIRDRVFGPMVMLGPGGLGVEGIGLERLAPGALSEYAAMRLIGRVPGLGTALRRKARESVASLALLLASASSAFAQTDLEAMEMNPVAWTDDGWKILDIVMMSSRAEGEA